MIDCLASMNENDNKALNRITKLAAKYTQSELSYIDELYCNIVTKKVKCIMANSCHALHDYYAIYTAARQLRSSSDNSVLRRPSVRTVSYGQRSFSYSAPSAWNSLPQQVRSSDNVSTFRSRTKTHLFRLAY